MTVQRSSDPEAFLAFERENWNAVIDGYERHFSRLTAQTVRPLLEGAGIASGARVLDVCTGHGVLAAAAVERGAEVAGIDVGEAVIAMARRNVPKGKFRVGDAQALPYAGDSFDAALCGYGIIHLPEPDRALAEMYRVLRPGGRLALSVWERPSSDNAYGLLFGAIDAHGRRDVPLPHGPDFFQFSAPGKLSEVLTQIGFLQVEVTSVSQFWDMERSSDLIDSMLRGGVRIRALLNAQELGTLAAIKAAVEQGMDQLFRKGSRYQVPMPALIAAADKASASRVVRSNRM